MRTTGQQCGTTEPNRLRLLCQIFCKPQLRGIQICHFGRKAVAMPEAWEIVSERVGCGKRSEPHRSQKTSIDAVPLGHRILRGLMKHLIEVGAKVTRRGRKWRVHVA